MFLQESWTARLIPGNPEEVLRHVQHQQGVDAGGDELSEETGGRTLPRDRGERWESVSDRNISVIKAFKAQCDLSNGSDPSDYYLLLPPRAEEDFFGLSVEETGHVALPLKSAANTENKLVQGMHAVRATLVQKCPPAPPRTGKAGIDSERMREI